MKDVHIAIFNTATPVHVNPTLSVVCTLIRRGYRVTYVTSERFASRISAIGAEVLRCPRFAPAHTQPNVDDTLPIEEQFATSHIDMASRTLKLVSSFYERNVPTLVMYDMFAFAGQLLAKQFGIPAIRITPHLAYDPEYLNLTVVPPRFRQLVLDFSGDVDGFFRDHGVVETGLLFDRQQKTLFFYLEQLQLGEHVKNGNLYAPRCAGEHPTFGVWKSRCTDRRRSALISASMGFQQGPGYYRMCAEVTSMLQWHSVLAIGSNNTAGDFYELPPNCEIFDTLPQIMVMPHVNLLICLGGMTTTMEAMYHSLPLLMLTHGEPEAELYAENIQNHGLGIHLKGNMVTSDRIKEGILQISRDGELQERVKMTGQLVRQSPGSEDVVNWIEDYLEKRDAACTGLAGQE